MKYLFKIILDNSEEIIIEPNILENNLENIDKYVSEQGSMQFFLYDLCKKNNIEHEIKDIKIITKPVSKYEYSIINNNKYLTPALYHLETKSIKLMNEKFSRTNTTVISTNSEEFKEMYNYLLDSLKIEGENFLKKIYTNKNELSNLINMYLESLKNKFTVEDEENIKILKNELKNALSIYKNYRSMCIARYMYEKKLEKNSFGQFVEIDENNGIRYKNIYVNDLGEEKEEFLDSDEINESYGTR